LLCVYGERREYYEIYMVFGVWNEAISNWFGFVKGKKEEGGYRFGIKYYQKRKFSHNILRIPEMECF
jgi:hypothetical protein